MLLAFMATAQAQGVSYIGLCNATWDCKAIKATWRGQGTIITGWLEQSFGRSCKCADELLRSVKNKIVRIHLINSPCIRNKRCGRQEVFAGDSVSETSRKVVRGDKRFRVRYHAIVRRVKRRLANAKGSVQCYVSPCLECDLSRAARRVLLNSVRRYLPMCVPVDNPLRGRCVSGAVCERHGVNPGLSEPCISDLDGIDGKDVDLKKFYNNTKSCDVRFYWEPFMNCNTLILPFKDPMERDCRTNKRQTIKVGRKSCRYLSHPSFDIC